MIIGEILENFLLTLGIKQGFSLTPRLLNVFPPSGNKNANRQEKEAEYIQIKIIRM